MPEHGEVWVLFLALQATSQAQVTLDQASQVTRFGNTQKSPTA